MPALLEERLLNGQIVVKAIEVTCLRCRSCALRGVHWLTQEKEAGGSLLSADLQGSCGQPCSRCPLGFELPRPRRQVGCRPVDAPAGIPYLPKLQTHEEGG